MNDLRNEIRDAFATEQAAYPDDPALRFDVIRALEAAGPSRRTAPSFVPRLQWPLAAVAVLVIAAILAGLVAYRLLANQSVPSYTSPPMGVWLFYVVDPHDAAVLDAFDWAGNLRGQIRVPQPIDPYKGNVVDPAPDGSSFIFTTRGHASYLDRLGRVLAGQVMPAANYTMWSADGGSQCGVGYDARKGWQLWTQKPGGQEHLVASALSYDDPTQGQLAPIACSFSDDRAVVVRQDATSPDVTDLWEITVSNGAVIATRHFSPVLVGSFVASPRGEYLGFNSVTDPPSPTIQLLSGGPPITSLASTFQILAFSGDGSRVLVSTGQGAAIVDWRSGLILWSVRDTAGGLGFLAEPGGNTFAVSVAPVVTCIHKDCPPAPSSITLVQADGSTVTLSEKYVPLW